jgi:A/G-specific adenine glycosylase
VRPPWPWHDPCVPAEPPSVAEDALVGELLAWFDVHERPLPWRSSTPWGVLVSEFMLQQTPVDRVLPRWHEWLERWPRPADLAASPLADVLRAWGRLGYPRRAKRLHEAARLIVQDHGGEVPADLESLLALPGVGDYTAAAVMAFAYGRRSIVMDTHVRRVIARTLDGRASALPHITAGERARAADLWPSEDARSARWSAAVMEFGALVCTARRPACEACPVLVTCAWTALGQPVIDGSVRRQPEYVGSDRQARGHVLGLLRESTATLTRKAIQSGWSDPAQAARALDSLVADGLVEALPRGRYALPH